jgi:hypothetical protein
VRVSEEPLQLRLFLLLWHNEQVHKAISSGVCNSPFFSCALLSVITVLAGFLNGISTVVISRFHSLTPATGGFECNGLLSSSDERVERSREKLRI